MATGKLKAEVTPSVIADKWSDTIHQAQAAAKKEKPQGAETKDPKKSEKFTKIELISGSTWDAFCPPPASSFKVRKQCGFRLFLLACMPQFWSNVQRRHRHHQGKVVPRVLNRYSKRRKISIEVHKVTPLAKEEDDKGNFMRAEPYEECVIR